MRYAVWRRMKMALLKDSDRQEVTKILAGLQNDVKLLMFTQEQECQFCAATHELVEELATLSEKLSTETSKDRP